MNQKLAEQVKYAGVVGAGGGGFPTHVKLQTKAQVVILNAAECEPLLHKDKEILKAYPDEVMEGVRLIMSAVGAKRGILGIKGKYTELIASLKKKLHGLEIAELSDTYPAGDEFILVYDTIGKVIPPGGLPLSVGAVVVNVETAWNIQRSQREAVTEKFLTVGGAVREPSTFRVAVGTSLRSVIDAAGGTICERPAVLVGGAMMGQLETDLDASVTKTTGGLIILPFDHRLVQRRQWSEKQIRQIGRSGCDQCSFCTELCPRYLLGHPVEPHKTMRSLGFFLSQPEPLPGTQFCCECNLCSMVSCPEGLDPRNVCAMAKRKILGEGKKWANAPVDSLRAKNLFPHRRIPIQRLVRQIGLGEYKNAGPLRLETKIAVQKVKLLLKQHAGVPAEPVVKAGDRVTKGQVVGRVPEGKLGADIHASIAGVVVGADRDGIIIQS